MASSSSRTKSSGPVLRSLSPSTRFCSYTTTTSFSSRSSTFFNQQHQHQQQHHHRAASPTRVNLYSPAPLSSAVRSISNHVIAKNNRPISAQKKTCMCSPSTHPGSFRCSLHKNTANNSTADSYTSNRLNMRRSAMKNSLVRIGGVEGDWIKRSLAALIRPSSHHQRRRAAFEPRSSRLSVMSKRRRNPVMLSVNVPIYYVWDFPSFRTVPLTVPSLTLR